MKRKQLAEAIKSVITSSPQYEKIQSELKDDRLSVKVRISFKEGIDVLVEKDIPKWSTDFAANSVGRGKVYIVYFEDGNKGMVLHRLNNTYTPLCVRVSNFEIDSFKDCRNLKAIYVPGDKVDYYKEHFPADMHWLIVEEGSALPVKP